VAKIIEATSQEDIEQVRMLFAEYRAELVVEPCFQSFDQEIASLPGSYAPPGGKLLLAKVVGQPVGCIGLRAFPADGACEMKRLYVRPPFRGDKVGRQLAERIVQEARNLGYRSMRLDSHPATMAPAVRMYRKLGFREVNPDPLQPIDGLVYLELPLA
jgi:GNAT superfamily N-acetyltransferase